MTLSWLPKGLEKEGGCTCGHARAHGCYLALWSSQLSISSCTDEHSETMPHANRPPRSPTVASEGNHIWSHKGGTTVAFQSFPTRFPTRRGRVVALPFGCECLSRPGLPCEWSWESDMTGDRNVQAARRTVSFQGASFGRKCKIVPPATQTWDEIKGHPWKLRR